MSEKPDLSKAITNYRSNMKEDMIALWKIWGAFHQLFV